MTSGPSDRTDPAVAPDPGAQPQREGGSEGRPAGGGDPPPASRRRTVLAVLVVVVLAVDAVLLAWTEMAWLTLRAGDTGIPLPLAALVALVTTPVLVLAADAARPVGRAALVPLALWTLTVLGAGLWSPLGAGVLPPDWRAILLLAAGVLPGAFVLARGSGRRPPGRGSGTGDGPTGG